MVSGSADPRVIRSIAVTASDVVAAFEANRGGGHATVLRVTPPFSGMMRARLHRAVNGDNNGGRGETPTPIEVDPSALFDADLPTYPHPDETEDALRADPDVNYTTERHHERHRKAVRRWRERARNHIAKAVEIQTPAGPQSVDVTVLGGRG